jgi:hypothetical protein
MPEAKFEALIDPLWPMQRLSVRSKPSRALFAPLIDNVVDNVARKDQETAYRHSLKRGSTLLKG